MADWIDQVGNPPQQQPDQTPFEKRAAFQRALFADAAKQLAAERERLDNEPGAEPAVDEWHREYLRRATNPQTLHEHFEAAGLVPPFINEDGHVDMQWFKARCDEADIEIARAKKEQREPRLNVYSLGLSLEEICKYLEEF